MKRIGDWLYVLGVNTLSGHFSAISIRGERKHDNPASFSYHGPWWEAYHVSAEYFTRLSLAMSSYERNTILVLEPTTTAWMYQMVVWRGDKQDYVTEPARLKKLGDRFFQLVLGLSKAQVEYDIGGEDNRPKRLGRRQAIRHRKTKVHDGRLAAICGESECEDD